MKSALRSLSDCLEYVDNRTPVVVAVVYAKATGSWSIVLWPCWTMLLGTHILRFGITVQGFRLILKSCVVSSLAASVYHAEKVSLASAPARQWVWIKKEKEGKKTGK